MATIQKGRASPVSFTRNKYQEKADRESNKNDEKDKDEVLEGAKNNEESPKHNSMPVVNYQFRMSESEGHKTLEN